jgi:UDP-N-acetyl-D-glucosamine dehydrogenase
MTSVLNRPDAAVPALTDEQRDTPAARLLERLRTRHAVVGVVGLGYVGLPLAAALAEAGFRVVGFDVSADRVALLTAGTSPIPDVPSTKLRRLVAPLSTVTDATNRSSTGADPVGSVCFTDRFDLLAHVDAAVICVPTPLDERRDPDMSFLVAATESIARSMHRGMLVVLESTTYPGTTEEVVLPRLAHPGGRLQRRCSDAGVEAPIGPHFTVGEDFFLAFSPERIDPGRTDHTVRTTPKVVGGMTPTCTELAAELYSAAVDTVVPVSQPRAAEMVKLLENTFRMLNIGLANELAVMCDRLDVDVWEVISAAATKPFGFMPFYPGPGLGGHCIPVDPHYLSWKMRSVGYTTRFIQVAAEMNQGMPEYVVEKVVRALNDSSKALRGSRVLVLGVAYKADISDVRESPALEILSHLMSRGADVAYHDSHVPSLQVHDRTLASVTLDEHELERADCVVIVTAHADIDWAFVAANTAVVVDTRNALAGVPSSRAKVVKL